MTALTFLWAAVRPRTHRFSSALTCSLLRGLGSSALCALAGALITPALARADLSIRGALITHSGHVVDTLASNLQIKGPVVRRSLEGAGTLADFFGRRVEIMHRTSGASTVLDLTDSTYTRSTGAPRVCHPWNLFDLRWLGRAPDGVKGELVWPDTVAVIVGRSARAFEFRFPTRQGGSTIRFWVVSDVDSLFGSEAAQSLYCGGSEAEADRALSEQLSKQFALSPEAREKLAGARLGFPVRIESFMGQGSARQELSRFETLAVEQATLADSLFEVPASFKPAGSPKGR